jgi:glycosyltransferase involved in cell wall biosynthesis
LTTAVIDECSDRGIPSVITLHDYKLACPSYVMMSRGRVCDRCVTGAFYQCAVRRCHKASLPVSLVSTIESYFNRFFRKYLNVNLFIAPSRFLAELMIRGGIPADRVRVVPNGIDCDRIAPCDGNDDGYGLYLGRLSPEKGLRTLLRAAVRAKLRLRVVGDGPERASLERDVLEAGWAGITFEGRRAGVELDAALRGASFVVIPSEWYENAPMSVLESMAWGKPVIASQIGGIPELVADQETGLLFEPGNHHALADAMHALAVDSGLRRAMGRAARRRVEDRFSLEEHCRRLLRVYEDAGSKRQVA